MKTETYILCSRVLRIFLSNIIKIDPFNFELYTVSKLVHFLRQCSLPCVLSVQVIFAPRIAGVYVAQLSLSCGPVDRSLPVTDRLPVMVTLQAVAENPSVEVRPRCLHALTPTVAISVHL